MRPVVLCFSGLDPSGGAGLQADIETIASLGGHAAVVCTALTTQDRNRVYDFLPVDPALINTQARTVLADLPVAAIKLGMLGSAATAAMLVQLLSDFPGIPVIIDPVLAANSGGNLASGDLQQSLLDLLPLATLVTPNTVEARRLAGTQDLDEAIRNLQSRCQHVLVKGGHEAGESIINRLYSSDGLVLESHIPRLPGEFHGTGCMLASAIACLVAQGKRLPRAVSRAELLVGHALALADRPRPDGQFLPVRIQP